MKNMPKGPRVSAQVLRTAQKLPADAIVYSKLVVTRQSGVAILEQLKAAEPTGPLRDLLRDRG
jgi:hypothetical protein